MALPPALILYIAGHVIHGTRQKAKVDFLVARAEAVIRERSKF